MWCNALWSDCHEWSDYTPLWSSHGSWSGSWEVLWGGSCSCVSWYWASPDRRCNPISASCHPSSWRCRSPWDSWPPALSAAHSLRLPPSDPEQITGHGLEKPPHLIAMTTKPEVSGIHQKHFKGQRLHFLNRCTVLGISRPRFATAHPHSVPSYSKRHEEASCYGSWSAQAQ